ncbi:hypothetical protein ROZALSC1DRAFT_31807 [Rozella allomycis CSF55]|uniref:Uncharacterized protein n=1 Tax=Rozella allomycis (strain CSF55) TaxID=988480 RepID=A0A4P9YAR5_ROZAC|nr:hypothetical protein ROZALSC1DRAFT_31807 [Rozella allomycis CSF55]
MTMEISPVLESLDEFLIGLDNIKDVLTKWKTEDDLTIRDHENFIQTSSAEILFPIIKNDIKKAEYHREILDRYVNISESLISIIDSAYMTLENLPNHYDHFLSENESERHNQMAFLERMINTLANFQHFVHFFNEPMLKKTGLKDFPSFDSSVGNTFFHTFCEYLERSSISILDATTSVLKQVQPGMVIDLEVVEKMVSKTVENLHKVSNHMKSGYDHTGKILNDACETIEKIVAEKTESKPAFFNKLACYREICNIRKLKMGDKSLYFKKQELDNFMTLSTCHQQFPVALIREQVQYFQTSIEMAIQKSKTFQWKNPKQMFKLQEVVDFVVSAEQIAKALKNLVTE